MIAVVDNNLGLYPTMEKLHYVTGHNCVGVLWEQTERDFCAMLEQSKRVVENLDVSAVVLGNPQFAHACQSQVDGQFVFGCDAPVLHALTYTASNVLLCADGATCHFYKRKNLANLLCLDCSPMLHNNFYNSKNRQVCQTVCSLVDGVDGRFDCIVFAHSNLNLYKTFFQQCYPNVKLFDNLEGVARKLKKRLKKGNRDGQNFVLAPNGEKITEMFVKKWQ
ncbi:MAG: hypothetical protein IJD18_03660 [Clostridia bacterium]|nr:hypothetical protein [Clostridia bacterium]